ncbi:hypothetical protein [Acinetobacter baumannii]|uniref:hypothetical protein n=2 Tax=Acinetobacter baumannii TaxID=470 RepID=UPI0007BCD406|nr:hypothetical protein [Acinetobacter baumannii]ANC36174.1 hypothetical protein Aba3207_05865 [Acinetobacter baumannii]ASO70583.1 hypothetical protein Aba7804_07125 [Acinetobacter baumannii]ATD18428.1 hypothetical protein BS098_00005 [Acinetobacter baumannii]AXG85814.1 hypothetical protein Aba810CP_14015 [Acinetobacter baumannii]EII5853627.1 hypothetical protein [Acinetobacter baumannii]
MDKFEEDLREILAQSKHKSSGAERFVQASLAENKYPKDFLIYFINSECFGDYESELPAYEAWQHQQAKVEELQTLYTQQGINMFKLQKRVDAVIIEIENMYLSGAIGFDTVKKLEQALKGEGQ